MIRRKFRRKSPIFPTARVFILELGIGAGSEETRMMALPGGRKSFKVGSAVLIQYRRVADTQPASRVTVASTALIYYVARVMSGILDSR